MRRVVLGMVALTLVASCKLHSLAGLVSFEGEIDMDIGFGSGGPASSIKIEMKGDRSRVETGTPGLTIASITDASAKKQWTLNPVSHTYTEVDLAALSSAKTAAPSKTAIHAHKTGRSDKVAGYDCDVWEIDDPSGVLTGSELCMTSGLSTLALAGLSSGPFSSLSTTNDGWSEVLSHGFPLRMTVRMRGSGAAIEMRATRIERKSVPDTELQIPPGYTKAPTFPYPTMGSGTITR